MSAAAGASFGFKVFGSLAANDKSDEAKSLRMIANRSLQGIKQVQAMQARRSFLRNARSAIADTTSEATANVGGLDSSAFRGSVGSLITQREVGVAEQRSILGAEEKARIFNKKAGKKEDQGQEIKAGFELASSAIGAFGGKGGK